MLLAQKSQAIYYFQGINSDRIKASTNSATFRRVFALYLGIFPHNQLTF